MGADIPTCAFPDGVADPGPIPDRLNSRAG